MTKKELFAIIKKVNAKAGMQFLHELGFSIDGFSFEEFGEDEEYCPGWETLDLLAKEIDAYQKNKEFKKFKKWEVEL